MMKFESSSTLLWLGVALIWGGGSAMVWAQDNEGKTTFVDHVLPVLEESCVSCHNPDEAKGGLDLSSYSATMSGGSGGQIVEAGGADRSRLFTLSAHMEEPYMPPMKPKIEQAKLDVLKRWIEEGLLETKGSKARKMTGPALTASVDNAGERPKDPSMPKHVLMQPVVVTERGAAITAIAASPWAPLVAIGGQKQVLLYRTEPLELMGILAFPEGFPEALSFSRNGSLILAGGGRGGKSGKAVGWDVTTGERVVEVGREFDTALAADISPDHRLVTLGGPGRNIKIYDTQTGEQLHSIKKHPDWLLEVEYSPDGVLLASAGRNGEIFVWESGSGIEFYALPDHQKAVTGLSWRGDSNVLAACSEDGNVTLWEMQNGKQMKKWAAHPGGVLSIDFSPDGSRLVTCGRDKTVKIWDLNGALQREIKGFTDIVTAVTFTHEGKQVISGDWQGELKLWDAATGAEVGRLVSNPPTVDVQLTLAQERVKELQAKMPELEKAVPAASAAAAEAVKKRDAMNQAVAQVKKDQADADQLVKRGDQILAEAAGKVKAAEGASQVAQKAVADAKAAPGQARGKVESAKAALAEVEKKLAALPQEIAALEKQVGDTGQKAQQAVQAGEMAKKAVEGVKFELEQLPGNPGIEAKLAEAQKALVAAEVASKNVEAAHQAAKAQKATRDQALAEARQSKEERARDLKAAELLVSQSPTAQEKADKHLAEVAAQLAEAKKHEQTSKGRVEEARKLLANYAGVLKQKEDAAAAAVAELSQVQARESAAKTAAARAKQDLTFAQYQIDKWQAAMVNVELSSESELMVNYRERYIQLEGRVKSAVEAHDSAAQSLAQAEQTLKKAQEVIRQSNEIVESAKDQVVETGLKVLAARLVDEMVSVGTVSLVEGARYTSLDEASVGAITAQAPEFQKELETTATKVRETLVQLEKASRTAEETPAMIEEKARQRVEKEAEMKKVVELAREQEQKVQDKEKTVEELRKRYEELYREWGQDKPVVSSPAK